MTSALVYAALLTAWGIFLSVPILTLARDIPQQADSVLALASDMIPDEQETEIRPNMLHTVVQNINLGGIDASVYHFNKFPANPPGIDLFDSATIVDGSVRLVQNRSLQVGSILTKVPIRFYNQARRIAGVFGTSFQYRFVGPFTAGRPRDGFTFILTASNTARGRTGGNLGYAGSGNRQSAAIEFDVFQNTDLRDPNNNHIGFDTQDNVTSVVTTAGTSLLDLVNNGNPVYVWIQFWPQGGPLKFLIQIFISTTPTRPQTAALEAPADLAAILGVVRFDNLFVGFTAATGGGIGQILDITDWAFFSASLQ